MKYIALEYIDDEFLVEDAVHEAFIKLTRYIKVIDENDRHKTKNYIVLVIRCVCVDILRKEDRDKSVVSEEIDVIDDSSVDSFKNVELKDVYAVIETLSDKYRDVIQLKVYYDLSDKEIADILCISNATVRKRLQRAREILKKKLAERGEDYVSV